VFLTALSEGTISLSLPTTPGAVAAAEDAGSHGGSKLSTLRLTKTWCCPDCPLQLIITRRIVGAGYKINLAG